MKLEVQMNIILTGIQGSGKGTQAKALSGILNLKHISTGDVLRKHIAEKTEFGLAYEVEYNKGNLAPDSIVFDIINYETTHLDGKTGYILDGFPRTQIQAEWVMENLDIDHIIELAVPRERAMQWALGRGRSDDTEDAINTRFNTYETVTKPAVAYLGVDSVIDGTASETEVTTNILDYLNKGLPLSLKRLVMVGSNWGFLMITITFVIWLIVGWLK